MVQQILQGLQILNDQARLDRPKTMDSKAVPQTIEGNPASVTKRVSAELNILQSIVVHHLHDLNKNIKSC